MPIYAQHLANAVIVPTLNLLAEYKPALMSMSAVELLLGTIAVESTYGKFSCLKQLNGPALGLYQIEPATHEDLYKNYLRYRKPLREKVVSLLAPTPDKNYQLMTNLCYATTIARLLYYRRPTKLAKPGDIEGHAKVWKQDYNTYLGKGSEEKFVQAWNKYIATSI